MDGNKKMALLGSTPIPKALLALGIPTMTGMLINALYNLADTYFVGGLGTDQMGAVTVAFPLGQIIVGLACCSETVLPPIFPGCWAGEIETRRTKRQARPYTAAFRWGQSLSCSCCSSWNRF